MKRALYLILLLVCLLPWSSCDRIRRKASYYKYEAIDKTIVIYDAAKPDTKFNQRRFREHLGIDCTSDVKNLYCFDSRIGIDSKFQFSFTCDSATISRIARHNGLKQEEPRMDVSGLADDFSWWRSEDVHKVQPYWRKGTHQWYQFLWYDQQQRKAYYLEFDM